MCCKSDAGIFKKILYYILIITIFLTGMCLRDKQADSCFLYEDSTETVPHIFYIEKLIMNEDSCTAEQLGLFNPEGIISQMKPVMEKGCIRAALVLPPLAILPENPIYLPEMTETGQKILSESRNVIIGYIHHQDGSKGLI